MEMSGDNWRYKTCKAAVKSSPSTNQHPVLSFLFAGQMPSLLANQQSQSIEEKNITFHRLTDSDK